MATKDRDGTGILLKDIEEDSEVNLKLSVYKAVLWIWMDLDWPPFGSLSFWSAGSGNGSG